MADSKVADLTAVTTLDGDELLYIVDSPSGTPADRKVTAKVLSGIRLIDEQELGSSAATITFSSIPATYRHLRVMIAGRQVEAVAFDYVGIRFNGDTAANYNWQTDYSSNATGTAAPGAGASVILAGYLPGSSAPAGFAGALSADIYDYRSTTFHKLVTTQSASFQAAAAAASWAHALNGAGSWENTAAITSVALNAGAGNFATGTVASLYGLVAE